jgi:hypothetical protein
MPEYIPLFPCSQPAFSWKRSLGVSKQQALIWMSIRAYYYSSTAGKMLPKQ